MGTRILRFIFCSGAAACIRRCFSREGNEGLLRGKGVCARASKLDIVCSAGQSLVSGNLSLAISMWHGRESWTGSEVARLRFEVFLRTIRDRMGYDDNN
jgi:hypothetical protein